MKKLLILCMSLLCFLQGSAAGADSESSMTRAEFTRYANGVFTLAFYGLLAGSASEDYRSTQTRATVLKSVPKVDPAIKQVVDEQLRKVGVTDPSAITVSYNLTHYDCSLDDVIFLSPKTHEILHSVLVKGDDTKRNLLAGALATVHHEQDFTHHMKAPI